MATPVPDGGSVGYARSEPSRTAANSHRPVSRTLDIHGASARPDATAPLQNPTRRPPGQHAAACEVSRHQAIDSGARLDDSSHAHLAANSVNGRNPPEADQPHPGRGQAVYALLAGMPTYQQTPRLKARVDALDHLNQITPLKSRLKEVATPQLELQTNQSRWRQDRTNGAPIDQRERIVNEECKVTVPDNFFSGAAGKGSLDPTANRGKRYVPVTNTMVDEVVFGHQMAEPLREPGEVSPFPKSISGCDINHIPGDVHDIHVDSAGWRSWVEPANRAKGKAEVPAVHTSRNSYTNLPYTKRRYMPDHPMATSFFDNVVLGRDTNFAGDEQYTETFQRMFDGAAGTPSWYTGDREMRCSGMLDGTTYAAPTYSTEKEQSGCPVEFRTHSPRTWSHGGRGQHPYGHQANWWPKLEEQIPRSASSRSARDGDQGQLRREQTFESPAGLNARNLGIRAMPTEQFQVGHLKRQHGQPKHRARSEPPQPRLAGSPTWATASDHLRQFHGPHGPYGFRNTGDSAKLPGNPLPESPTEPAKHHHLSGGTAARSDARWPIPPHTIHHSELNKRVGDPPRHPIMTDSLVPNRWHTEYTTHLSGARAKLQDSDRGRSSSTAFGERGRSSSTQFGRSWSRGRELTRSPSVASNRSAASAASASSRRVSGRRERTPNRGARPRQ